MAVKRGIIVAVGISVTLCLSGCLDKMPDMTQEENDIIAEYAASILLKHSNSYNYRLVNEKELERSLFEDNQAALAAIEEAKKQEMEENTSPDEDATDNLNNEENSTESNSSDSNNDENEQQDQENATEGDSETINVETVLKEQYATDVDLASLIGSDDKYTISFVDYETADSYPKEVSDSGFELSASRGNTLLVLKFLVENKTDSKVYCDMFDINPKISINVNDSGYQAIEGSLLLNDFMTYIGDIGANQSIELVAIYEMTGTEIDSIMLQVGRGSSKTELIIE